MAHELRMVSQGSSGIELAVGADVDPLVHVSLEGWRDGDFARGGRISTLMCAPRVFHADGTVTLRAP